MKETKELLDHFLEKIQVDIKAEQARPEITIYNLWPQLQRDLGYQTLAEHSKVLQLEKGVLLLGVEHSVFIQELKMTEDTWRTELEKRLKNLQIKVIRYKLFSLPKEKPV